MRDAAEKLRMMNWNDSLVFTKDGEWLHNGEPVMHRGVAEYFSKHLGYSHEHQSFVLAVEGRCVRVTVQDTPVVVRTLAGESESGWMAVLSSGEEEELDCGTLSVSDDGEWYCRVKNGEVRARLLRPAIQHLLGAIEEAGQSFTILCRGRRIPIDSA